MVHTSPLRILQQGQDRGTPLAEILDALPPGLHLVYQVAIGVLLVLLSLVAARRIKGRVERTRYLSERDPAAAELVSNLAYVGTLALGVILALSALEVEVTAVLAVFGTAGLAVSLALQDVLRNFVAGIYILLERPFNIGDQIALRDHSGDILGIELRTTRLRTTSGAEVIVPNAVVMTEILTNRSLSGLQPYVLTISGGKEILDAGLDRYLQALHGRADISAQPAPEVLIESLEVGKASIRLRFWSRKGSTVVAEVVSELERRAPETAVAAKAEV